jgi:hypothetical protein
MDNTMDKHTGGSSFGRCSCCGSHREDHTNEISRRKFVQVAGATALGTVAMPGLTWPLSNSSQAQDQEIIQRKPLIIKTIFTYATPQKREHTSWRSWGGIQTEDDATQELGRIRSEQSALGRNADFPVDFLPVSKVKKVQDLDTVTDLASADVILVYAAGGSMAIFDALNKTGKDMIFFCRHKSGPVYLWYEIISPRFLRQHSDKLAVKGISENDVVIDSQEDIMWRLRALCGLKNTINSGIVAIGGASAWSQPEDVILGLVKDKFKLNIHNVSYEELGSLIKSAKSDSALKLQAGIKSGKYLKDAGIKLETSQKFVENCFVLEAVFRRIMDKFSCRAVTVNNCMGTIMPLAETTACLTLSLLNDAGYLAFCESDFVVVPSGILLANITGKPVFLNDPTYPHDGLITLAHCTAPRRMDGKKLEPARLLTHFESDFGAAPKVEMLIGQTVTNIMPDFGFKRNVGLTGKITDNPFMDICRSQIDVSFKCDSRKVAEQMPGFHWITVYGDYVKESEYAFKKIGIDFDNLG